MSFENDWIKNYVSRFIKKEVDENELNKEINAFINTLNEKLAKVCDEKIIFDKYKKTIEFPDCLVNYDLIAKKYIDFDIVKKTNNSTIVKRVTVSLIEGTYKVYRKEEIHSNTLVGHYRKINTNLMNCVFENLLT